MTSQYKDICEPPTAILRIGLLCAIHKTPARFETTSCEIRIIMHYYNSALCRLFFIGHSAKTSLPIVALGKVTLSVTTTFTESRTLGIDRHSAKRSLPSVNARQKTTLDKWPSAAVIADGCYLCRAPGTGTRQSSFFAECRPSDTRQTMLCRVSILDTRQSIFFIFFLFSTKLFVVCSYTMFSNESIWLFCNKHH
jgi:hypothetical protein